MLCQNKVGVIFWYCFMLKISLHNHTKWSDGLDTVEDLVKFAQSIGLTAVGISDHFCFREKLKNTLDIDTISSYVSEVKNIRKKSRIPVLLGLELELPRTTKEFMACFDIKKRFGFDFFIGSLHILPNNVIVGETDSKTEFSIMLAEHRLYWNTMLRMTKDDLIDIVGHMDLIKLSNKEMEPCLLPEISTLLSEIKKNKKIVEINTSGYDRKWIQDAYPSKTIIKKCLDQEIPLIISSDSHKKEEIIRYFDKVENLINRESTKLCTQNHYSKFLSYFVNKQSRQRQ